MQRTDGVRRARTATKWTAIVTGVAATTALVVGIAMVAAAIRSDLAREGALRSLISGEEFTMTTLIIGPKSAIERRPRPDRRHASGYFSANPVGGMPMDDEPGPVMRLCCRIVNACGAAEAFLRNSRRHLRRRA